MADGTYERRGPREAELKRLRRILEEIKERRFGIRPGGSPDPQFAGTPPT